MTSVVDGAAITLASLQTQNQGAISVRQLSQRHSSSNLAHNGASDDDANGNLGTIGGAASNSPVQTGTADSESSLADDVSLAIAVSSGNASTSSAPVATAVKKAAKKSAPKKKPETWHKANIKGTRKPLSELAQTTDFSNTQSINKAFKTHKSKGTKSVPKAMLDQCTTKIAKARFCQEWRNYTDNQQEEMLVKFREERAEQRKQQQELERNAKKRKRELERNAKKAEKEREKDAQKVLKAAESERKKKERHEKRAADRRADRAAKNAQVSLFLQLLCIYTDTVSKLWLMFRLRLCKGYYITTMLQLRLLDLLALRSR